MTGHGFAFPFTVATGGGVGPDPDEDDELHGKIVQVLLTSPGERVNLPEFGCGLFDLVFDPANAIMAAAVEFTIGQSLNRWLGDELVVGAVDVRADTESVTVEVAYLRRRDLTTQAVRVRFR